MSIRLRQNCERALGIQAWRLCGERSTASGKVFRSYRLSYVLAGPAGDYKHARILGRRFTQRNEVWPQRHEHRNEEN